MQDLLKKKPFGRLLAMQGITGAKEAFVGRYFRPLGKSSDYWNAAAIS